MNIGERINEVSVGEPALASFLEDVRREDGGEKKVELFLDAVMAKGRKLWEEYIEFQNGDSANTFSKFVASRIC